MDAKEVKTVIHSLEKTSDTKTILELLTVLKDEVKATESFLRETKVGVSVNKLRSHSSSDISNLVKKIIKKWKEEVSLEKRQKTAPANVKKEKSDTASTTTAATGAVSGASGESSAGENKLSDDSKQFISTKPRTPANDGIKVDIHENTTRNGSISGLYSALAIESTIIPDEILKIAKEIENEVFKMEFLKITDSYRNKMRSLIMNLRNKQNPELRQKILLEDIKPEVFIRMNNKELAPEALKEEMHKLHQKNLFDAQGAVEKRAVTDRFMCGKCKQRQVSYYQMQTRSADEPLTTFCTCESCGNRWKFC